MKRILLILLMVLLVQSTYAIEESDYDDQYEYIDVEDVYEGLPQEQQVEEEEVFNPESYQTECPPAYNGEEELL